jgi:hypothetical protein
MAESRTSSPDEAATEEREELLATKLNIPQPRPDQLRRSRLIDRLNQGMAQKLIMVCTPAGFGKTSLLADWAASTAWPVAWLSLDPHDTTLSGSGATWSARSTVRAAASPSTYFHF